MQCPSHIPHITPVYCSLYRRHSPQSSAVPQSYTPYHSSVLLSLQKAQPTVQYSAPVIYPISLQYTALFTEGTAHSPVQCPSHIPHITPVYCSLYRPHSPQSSIVPKSYTPYHSSILLSVQTAQPTVQYSAQVIYPISLQYTALFTEGTAHSLV